LLATAIGGLLGGIIAKYLGGYESKKSIFVLIVPEIITVINIIFLSFTKNFYIYNINLILFFFFISAGSPIILGYLIKTIPKPIKGIGIGLDMIVSTFLGKIPSPIIYGALDDKYSKTNPDYAWKFTLSYFYIGFLFVVFLCYFKHNEEIIEDSSEVKIEEQIVEIAAIGSGTDANDHFSLRLPTPKRTKTIINKKTELKSIFNDDDKDGEDKTNLTIN
jgi:sugar phosphate permease